MKTMEITFVTFTCYFLALSFVVAQKDVGNLTVTTPLPTKGLNLTSTAVTVNSTADTVDSNLTQSNDTITKTPAAAATPEGTTHLQLTPSKNITATGKNHTSLTTHVPTVTARTTLSQQTTGSHKNSSETTVITVSPPRTVNTTSHSLNRTAPGLGLDKSEMSMTVLFSVILLVFVMALVLFVFRRCKHKIQYLHQPLTNTDDADGLEADEDSLVISGGLYDGHPTNDNAATASNEQSQFRLEFLH
ncbi:sialomucin core protein 24-like [Xyrichtys novacula]|nr:sialomucin core protein 24-like [Xyrichtys novacula]